MITNNTKLFFITMFSVISIFKISFSQQDTPVIHPNLQLVLLNSSSGEMINVYAKFKEQYSLEILAQQTFYLPRKEKHKIVSQVLKDYADEKQKEVLAFLAHAKQQNLVSNINIIWALNTVAFTATAEVIYGLSENFNEISEIRYDPVIDENTLIDIGNILPPNDPMPDDENSAPQQGLILINAPAVWAEGDSGAGVLVGNIDTGCDWDHPDLVNNIWNNLGEDLNGNGATIIWNGSSWVFDPGDINNVDDDNNGKVDDFIGWDFIGNDNNPYNPSSTHGTKTSGIVCGDGTRGTQTGVAPKANIMILRPSGESQMWDAYQYCIDMGVDIITSSLSLKWDDHQPDYAEFRRMMELELAAGIVHTNSTSNDGNNLGGAPIPYNIATPGNCPPSWLHPDQTLAGGLSSVVGVGNVDAFSDIIMSSSPYGPAAWEDILANHPGYPNNNPPEFWDYPNETQTGAMGLLKPDVSAPGNNTTSTTNGVGYASFNGTSSATPHVAGTVALMLSINPELSPSDVSRILQTTSVEKGVGGKDNRYGAGRIDAYEAYLQALDELPVELVSFSASVNENNVLLRWSTATETNNLGFEIQRSDGAEFYKIGFVAGHGTTVEGQSYTYADEKLYVGNYLYRLKQMDYDGTTEYSNSIKVELTKPFDYELSQNYPNPFNPSTRISYSIPAEGLVKMKLYDVLGNEVASIVNEVQPAGKYEIEFSANALSSGVYFYTLSSGTFISTKKIILMK